MSIEGYKDNEDETKLEIEDNINKDGGTDQGLWQSF